MKLWKKILLAKLVASAMLVAVFGRCVAAEPTKEETITSLAADMASLAAAVQTIPEPIEDKIIELRATRNGDATSIESSTSSTQEYKLADGWTCSGAFIDSIGDILTARHCTEHADSIEVVTHDGQHYNAIVVSTSAAHDLAMIHIDRRETPFFQLANNVVRGEQVFILGSPLAITDTLTAGIIAKLNGDVTILDCTALPGNSGGPVFDQDGRLVGVLTGGYIVMMGTTGLNYAQSLDAIGYFLVDALENRHGRSH